MEKVALVTGATGLLGRQVVKAFDRAGWKVVGTGLTRANPPDILKVDLLNEDEISKVLNQVKPQVVVHCAAQRSPDKVALDPSSAHALNVSATHSLAALTSPRHILLLYISTDYVFPGAPGSAPYDIDATPSPPNLYGQTKLDGENAVLSATQDTGLGVVLRVPVLYGETSDAKESAINVLLDAVWKAREKDAKIAMDDWAQRYPTNTEDVARVCVDIATIYLPPPHEHDKPQQQQQQLPRILHFSSEDRYTKYGICELLAEILGLPLDGMVPDRRGNEGVEAGGVQRPYDTHLETRGLRGLGVDVQTQDFGAWWRREVRAFRR